MTRDVWISLKGLQHEPLSGETVTELIVAGEYYFRNGRHFIIYDEIMEEMEEPSHNTIKFRQDYMELTRKGPCGTHMIFEEDKQSVTYYDTPFGSLRMGVDAKKIRLTEAENEIEMVVDYALEMNAEKLGDCRIHMKITPRENGELSLR